MPPPFGSSRRLPDCGATTLSLIVSDPAARHAEQLRAPSALERFEGAEALGELGPPCGARHIPELAEVLRGDPDGSVRVAAAWALGRLSVPPEAGRCLSPLAAAMRQDGDALVREAAAEALALLASGWDAPEPPLAVLARGLEDPDRRVRRVVAAALGGLEVAQA